jgi:predicted ATPase
MVDQILQHCPQVTVLATSREGLGVLGEQVWAVPPLESEDAAELFDQRARASRPDYRPDHEAATAMAQICRYMDGLPLGIELAAARIRAMSPSEIAGRLDSVRVRTGGARTAQPRHQSLSAAIDWSYRLLSESEQRLFARLSVFAGGSDLRAIHSVCGSPGASEDDTLDLLTRLVDKSMVSPVSDRGQTRYHVLETLRGYGRDRLEEAGLHEQVARSQTSYFADLMELAAQGLQGPDERHWVARMLPDYDNLRGAFERAAADHDGHLALRLVTSVTELAHLRMGYEGAGWAERTVELAPQDAPLFAAAVGAAARGAWNRGDFTLARVLVARAGGRSPGRGTGRIAYPGDVLADVALYEGDVSTALHHYESETERARMDHDSIRLVWTLYYVAVCQAVQRAPHLGLAAARESLEVADATSNPTAQSMARYAVGLVTKKTDPDRALDLFDQASDLAASVQNFWWHGIALMEAAATRAVHRDATTAARALVDVLDHWDRVGDWTQQWLNLRYVVRLLLRVGAHEDAVELHHYLRAVGKPSPLDPAQLAELLEGQDGERIAAASRRGSALSGAAATSLARACLRRIG